MKNKVINIITLFILIINVFLLVKINLLNIKLLFLVILIEVLVFILTILLINSKNKIVKIFGYIINIIFIIIIIILSFIIANTNNLLNNIFNKNSLTITYYLISKKDVEDSNTIIYLNTTNKEVFNKLKEKYNKTLKEDIDIDRVLKSNDFILIDSSLYNNLFLINKLYNKHYYKILDKITIYYNVTIEKEIKNNFNIYIGGTDFTESFMDFNMILSINLNSNKVLLTSIPRDYYIEVYNTNRYNTLSYMGVGGINTNLKSLEKLFNTKIDYYIKINTNTLIELIDLLGGINWCSNISYKTTHALVTDTYDDTKNNKLFVKKGCQHINGVETLTIARERNAFIGRDRVRQENCRKIILLILEKIKAIKNINQINNLIKGMENLYNTNINRDMFNILMKHFIEHKFQTNIEENSVDGKDTIDYVHMSNLKDWVMKPNIDSVEKAKTKIKEIIGV